MPSIGLHIHRSAFENVMVILQGKDEVTSCGREDLFLFAEEEKKSFTFTGQ